MKKSELKIIGDYRMSPNAWGNESAVMIDEKKAVATMAECFGCSEAECDPDSYENDTPECVELAVDNIGNHFVLFTGNNKGLFQRCEDMLESETTGMLLTLGVCERFDDEDED